MMGGGGGSHGRQLSLKTFESRGGLGMIGLKAFEYHRKNDLGMEQKNIW